MCEGNGEEWERQGREASIDLLHVDSHIDFSHFSFSLLPFPSKRTQRSDHLELLHFVTLY